MSLDYQARRKRREEWTYRLGDVSDGRCWDCLETIKPAPNPMPKPGDAVCARCDAEREGDEPRVPAVAAVQAYADTNGRPF